MQKRQYSDNDDNEGVDGIESVKRAKIDSNSSALVVAQNTSTAMTLSKFASSEQGRTSSLMAPEVSLVGHQGAVYSIAFDPSGKFMCSGSFDKQICMN
jgi:WD40 repeat protein